MPPEVGPLIAQGGPYGVAVAIIWWLASRLEKVEAKYEAERSARNSEGLVAAKELYEERRSNDRSSAAIERRDERIVELLRELEKCERTVERWQGRDSTQPPRLEAGP